MPHVVVYNTPCCLMTAAEVRRMRAEIISAMIEVPGAGFEERQVRLSLPLETHPSGFRPWLVARFAYQPGRSEETLRIVSEAAAEVLYRHFARYEVEEVQCDFEIDFAGRFTRWPPIRE